MGSVLAVRAAGQANKTHVFFGVTLNMTRPLLLALSGLAVLAGCNTAPRVNEAGTLTPRADPVATAIAQPDDGTGAVTTVDVGAELEGRAVTLPAELVGRTVIYFPFDSDALTTEDLALLATHARFMAARSGVRVRLEGHTDERGTREYNIGLGERRAQAVRRALGLQGVAETRLTTVSYGEEQPSEAGRDEAAFAKNRRVELIYSAG